MGLQTLTRPTLASNSPIRSNASLIIGNPLTNPTLGGSAAAAGSYGNRYNDLQTSAPMTMQRGQNQYASA